MDPAPALSYESRVPGAMQADEVVLWERKPSAPEPIPVIRGALAIVGVIAFIAGLAAAVSGDLFAIVVSTIIAVVVVGFIATASLNEALARRRKLSRSTFRVTDRRVMRVEERAGGKCDELTTASLTHFDFEERNHVAAARFYETHEGPPNVEFGGVEQRETLESHIISQHLATQRRPTIRRTRHEPTMMDASAHIQPPHWLTLSSDELLLWTGRPLPFRFDRQFIVTRAIILGLLVIPGAVLLASTGMFVPFVGGMHWLLTVPAGIWIVGGLNAVFIKPFRDARRLARTSYALTNVRAVVHEAGRRRKTRSFLLDMADRAELTSVKNNASGTITIALGVEFEHIPEASQVFMLVLDAIRGSGAIAPPSRSTIVSDATTR
jgi:hypothetical protein